MHRGKLKRLVCSIYVAAFIAPVPNIHAPFLGTVYAAQIEPAQPPAGDWQRLTHARLGFKIDYPANVFSPVAAQQSEAGRILVTHDGRARLLIGAFDNDTQASLRAYRTHLLETSYAGAAIGYAPVRATWFVLSGTRNGTEFYERVSFTCSGRRITSWAMLYPHAQRGYYDPILEMIARSFRPSRSTDAGC